MTELTREQIEELRKELHSAWGRNESPRKDFDALCELALRALDEELLRDFIAANPRYNATAELQERIQNYLDSEGESK